VEPVNTLEDSIPVEVLAGSLSNSGVSSVVDAYGASLRSALLVEIDTHSVTTANDLRGVNAVAAKAVYSRLTDSVSGELGDIGSVHTVVCEGYRNVCLTSAEGKLNVIALYESLVVIGLKTEHKLTKGYNFHFEKFLSKVNFLIFTAYIVTQVYRKIKGRAIF
jgi:hypothetical protein